MYGVGKRLALTFVFVPIDPPKLICSSCHSGDEVNKQKNNVFGMLVPPVRSDRCVARGREN